MHVIVVQILLKESYVEDADNELSASNFTTVHWLAERSMFFSLQRQEHQLDLPVISRPMNLQHCNGGSLRKPPNWDGSSDVVYLSWDGSSGIFYFHGEGKGGGGERDFLLKQERREGQEEGGRRRRGGFFRVRILQEWQHPHNLLRRFHGLSDVLRGF